jgi:hypothetical protein
MSIRWVIDAIDASVPWAVFAASFPASFPAALGRRGDHQHRRIAWQVDRGRGQRDVQLALGRQHAAVGPPRPARPRDGGELRLHGGPRPQVHEVGQRLARRVPGRHAEQRGGP